MVEGAQSGAIEASVAIKLLFGKLDREMRRLIEEGEAALDATSSKELVKNLLYYLAHEPVQGPRAEAVVNFYNLAHLLPTPEELEHAHGSISGHNRELLDTVAGGIREDLLRIKDTLNVYLHSPQRNVADLAMQAETLAGLADTFGMLGMGQPRQLVRDQRDAINRIVRGEVEADEDSLLDIAGGLLVVEASLDAHIVRLGARQETTDAGSGSIVPRAEIVRLLYVLMKEALVNVTKVKEAVVAFIEAPWDHTRLESAPALLTEVAGALDMLGKRDAAKPVDAMVRYIRNELLEQKRIPEHGQIEAFADTVASIEYYIEAIREQRGDGERVLELMHERLGSLGYWSESRPVGAVAAEPAPAPAPRPVEAPPPDAAPIVDEELRQVFLDEMDEEIANLRTHFPLWRANPEEIVDLKIVRRSFHTLKGSGRLVGALALGDFAWKIENMLNRVLDRSIGASPPLLQIVGQAIDTLPNFRNEFARHERSSFAMEGFAAAIDRLCAGDVSPPAVDPFAESATAPPAIEAPAADIAVVEPAAAPAQTGGEPPALEVLPPVESGAVAAAESADDQIAPVVEHAVDVESPVVESDAEAAPAVAAEIPQPVEDAAEVEPVPAFAFEAAAGHEAQPVEIAADEVETAEAHATASLEPPVDRLLLEVLRSEAETHLGVIEAATHEHQPLIVREDLVRAAHTLNGAFAMIDAPQMAQLLAPFEGWLARARNAGHALDANGVGVLDDVVAAVKAALAALENGTAAPETAGLAARLAALRMEVPAGETIAHVEPEVAAVAPELDSLSPGDEEKSASIDAPAEQSSLAEQATAVDEVAMAPAAELPHVAPADLPAAESASPRASDEAAPAGPAHPAPDIDEDLLDVFLLEAQEILDRSDALLLRLHAAPGDTGLLDALRRDLHTIKGGANMSQLAPIGDLGHAMESLLEGAVEHGRTLDGAMLHAVEQGFDTLHTQVQAAAARQPTTMPTVLIARIEALSRGETAADAEGALVDTTTSVAPDPDTRVPPQQPQVEATEFMSLVDVPQQDVEPAISGGEYIRVRAAQLDTMVNGASEVAIYRSRLEQQIASYRGNVVEMETTVSRLRDQMRRLELEAEAQMASRFQREGDASSFDPLELDRFSQLQQLSRSLAESMSDLVSIQVGFDALTRQSESLLTQQSRVSADLQESLMRTRMVPFDSIVPALRRTLRQTAVALGKEAVLHVEGAQGEMDRTLLERMKAPLEHMLRNALTHGIESVPERLAGGKPVEGNVRIALAREATETVLRISDDGRGLDREAIRRRAIERGLLAADARVSDRELDAFILSSGFSTAESLTQLAGRGVGMDVVSNQIKQLGGSLVIESTPGRGAAFTVRLPFTLGVTQAIIVRIGEANYAIPMNAVQGAVHVPREEIDARLASEDPEYPYAGESFPIIALAPLLQETSPAVVGDTQAPLLIVRSGDQRAAVRVDAVHGSREIVVKSVGPQITSVPGILGATIMGDGSVIMILDLAPLLRRVAGSHPKDIAATAPAAAAPAPRRATIMVVDDSITMRKATTRVLERENMDVVTAKDGIDAIEKLGERIPDLVVLDIEMPRMDGYQFAEYVKADPRTLHVPIIMVTSRTGDKHRQRAHEIGVEGYLGKPYQEAELVNNIRELLGAAR
ncbi:MAG: Hpt domain-containing protein [Rudaea sp.]|uniref:Hpt domain-containing protein n=1 Tax=Rudaea sp. TaxID=2136325 RepID=UPI0039E45853